MFFSTATLFAQNKDIKTPSPKGGITAIFEHLVYPEEAKTSGIEGKVIVKAVVDERGKVVSTEVLHSLSKECDEAAIEAIRKTEFIPGSENGNNVKAAVVIPVQFRLK